MAHSPNNPSDKETDINVLEIFTFGGLRIQRDGIPVSKIGSKRVEALLVYLACTGRPHPREVLADLLWDDRPQKQAMSNLRTVLTGLRKQFGPFVTITRDSVGLNAEATIWRDTESLSQALTTTSIEDVDKLYQGNFLDGFYLRGSRTFEEWLIVERESWHQQVQDALSQTVTRHLARKEYRAGIPVARRLLQLDPLLEEAHRQLMRLLALSGQRAQALAQYETCHQILDEELGVEPSAETTALYEQIQSDALEPPSVPTPVAQSAQLPAFLDAPKAAAEDERPLFVARETELARLNDHLAITLEGEGQVVLITGEAGRGKTTLLAEFARRAQESHPTLIVASGTCNAYSGLGDPYLPFRELMAFLTADVETRWAAGTISREQARRLWQLMPQTAQALAERGPNLVEMLVPGAALTGRLAASGPEGQPWAERITELAAQAKTGSSSLEQAQIFEQIVQVLQTLAGQQPLLLILDDLQWADSASVSLLFHLARRLAGQQILIVGAYRPIALEADSASSHPFTPIAGEIKRLFGDIELDLGQTPVAEGRAFVDALLDSEPNTLGELFRAAMFGKTQGHPLFTVELLRDMQERGDVAQDETGRWTETKNLDWSDLPARVEAVIEQRLNRLDDDTQDMLAIAAVEGEVFTVQVIAHLHNVSERKLLRQLSRTLGKRHRLVSEQGEVTVGEQTLSRFQFRHVLFQQYLYDQLSPGEQRLLHTDVAAVLEKLYAGHTEEITVALARHYTEAGQGEQAIPHLLRAGDQARLTYAHEAAIEHYRQAVVFLKEQGDNERTADTLMKLGLTYHNTFDFEQSRLAYDEAFALGPQSADPQPTISLPPATPCTIKVAVTQDQALLPPDPKNGNTAAGILVNLLFSGLVEPRADFEVLPNVARSWEILADGQQYRFHLRDDVHWSDGTSVTAGDFVYAWRRVLNPAQEASSASMLYDIKGAKDFHQGRLTDPVQIEVRALNTLTLEVNLEGPTGYFLQLLTDPVTYPVPQHIVSVYGENWTAVEDIVTNGPFCLNSWQEDRQIVLTRNPVFHSVFEGNIDRIELDLAVWNEEVKLDTYQTGDLDAAIFYDPPPAMDRFQQQHPEQYYSIPQLQTVYLAFNIEFAPFDSIKVRQAFALTINRKTLANEIMGSYHAPANGGMIPPGMWAHSADLALPYNPDRARQFLADAGYPNGKGFPAVNILVPNVVEHMGQYLQSRWQETLGINVSLETGSFSEIRDRLAQEVPPLVVEGWLADYPDPDNFLRVWLASQNWLTWRNKMFEQLVWQARRSLDHQKREDMYRQADRILVTEETAVLPLTHASRVWLVKPWIKEFSFPTGRNLWSPQHIAIDPGQQPVRSQATVSPSKPANHTLRWMLDFPVLTLDPALCEDTTSAAIIEQVFAGLVEQGPEMEILPGVAKSWGILDGGRKYVFHLRDNVYWSDGSHVSAADFEYSWKRILNPATGATDANLLYDIKGARAFHQGHLSNPDEVGVRAKDDVTLVVELEQPVGYFLQIVALPKYFPVPRQAIEQHGEAWTEPGNIVANGPFLLKSWTPNQLMVFSRNPGYSGRSAGNVQHVEVTVQTGYSSKSLKPYEANQVDVVKFVELQVSYVQQHHTDEFISLPWSTTGFVAFNQNQPPFNDLRVRRAFALAFDREELAETHLGDPMFMATGGFVPAGIPGYSPGIGLPCNRSLARQLLAEAGFPNGRGFPQITMLTPEMANFGEGIQEQWETHLGVRISRQQLKLDELFERLDNNPPHIFALGWAADYPDPDSFLRMGIKADSPRIGWQNETYDALITKARGLIDQQERMKLYQQADRVLMEEAVIVPFLYRRQLLLVKPWIKNLSASPLGNQPWKVIIIDSSRQFEQLKPTTSPTAKSRTLRMAVYEPTTLDPTLCDDWSIQDQLFSGLVAESQDLQIIPDVAQSWEILDDGRKYVFYLRPDVRWSDGTPVTAADFEFAWKRALSPAVTTSLAGLLYDIKGARAFHQGEIQDAGQVEVQALDEHTLAVELEAPAGYFLHLMSKTIAFPVPQHVVTAHGEAWTAAEHIVTNGPFRVKVWNRHDSAILVRNPTYHGQFGGNIERVELKLATWDELVALSEYEADRIDVAYASLHLPEVDWIRQQYAGEYTSIPWLQTCYIGFDISQPPFDDSRVRRAFAMAIDKSSLELLISGGESNPATGGFIPTGMPGHSPNIGLPYNPDLARQLLTEAGYPDGHKFPQINWLAFVWAPIAEYLQRQWNKILGVMLPTAEIVSMTNFTDKFAQKSPRLFLAGWVADYPDPDNFLRTGVNPDWTDETYTALVEKARRLIDQQARLELYRQADKILMDEAIVIPVTYGQGHLLTKPWVKKYPTSPASWWFWKDVIIEEH